MESRFRRLTSVTRAVLLIATPSSLALVNAQQIGTCFDPASYRSADPIAEENLQRGSSYFAQKQYAAARRYLSLAAQRSHPRAEELMGQIYIFGYGVQANAETGFQYLSAAAAQGHRGAITDLGFYYSEVSVNLPKANTYFLAAARCGNLDAQAELALNYEFGRGIERNRQQAIRWLLSAAPHWGQAAYIAEWLQKPDTPHFQNADQLGRYIGARTGRAISIATPHLNGAPIPFTSGCYRSLNPGCSTDPNSAAYQHNHQ
jgi:TPR repeat protein